MQAWTTLLLGTSLLIGCAQAQPQFVGIRQVPESPSFVVFPLFETPEQYLYAGVIEAGLLGNGVKVLSRPQRKEITAKTRTEMGTAAESPASAVEGGPPQMSTSSAKQNVEVWQRFQDMGTEADYVVITHTRPAVYGGRVAFESTNVRIIRRETNEVVGSFPTLVDHEQESLRRALTALSMIPLPKHPGGPLEPHPLR
jgi:hypothetical protein